METNFNEIAEKARNKDFNTMLPNARKATMSQEDMQKIISSLARRKDLPEENCLAAINTLFLQGICNKATSNNYFVEVMDREGKAVKVLKKELMETFYDRMKSKNIRIMAESMSIQICQFAETHNLRGDLANQLDKLAIKNGENPLTQKEAAWANSFCQKLSDLEKYTSLRVRNLLFTDYNNRFNPEKREEKAQEALPQKEKEQPMPQEKPRKHSNKKKGKDPS